jgi:hypothetical protein
MVNAFGMLTPLAPPPPPPGPHPTLPCSSNAVSTLPIVTDIVYWCGRKKIPSSFPFNGSQLTERATVGRQPRFGVFGRIIVTFLIAVLVETAVRVASAMYRHLKSTEKKNKPISQNNNHMALQGQVLTALDNQGRVGWAPGGGSDQVGTTVVTAVPTLPFSNVGITLGAGFGSISYTFFKTGATTGTAFYSINARIDNATTAFSSAVIKTVTLPVPPIPGVFSHLDGDNGQTFFGSSQILKTVAGETGIPALVVYLYIAGSPVNNITLVLQNAGNTAPDNDVGFFSAQGCFFYSVI